MLHISLLKVQLLQVQEGTKERSQPLPDIQQPKEEGNCQSKLLRHDNLEINA
jgi:hypothetical protein